MSTAKKYMFDVSFDHVGVKPVAAPPPPPPVEEAPKVSLAELEDARQAALAEGHRLALAEAQAAVSTRAAAAIEKLVAGIGPLLAGEEARGIERERQAIAALRVIIAKALPALAAREQLGEIEALAKKCLVDAFDEPRIVLRVANDLYEPIRDRLDAIAAASGYAGRIVLLADDALSGGDARIEWADGGVERKLAEQLGAADAVLARFCDPAATPNPIPPSPRGDE